MRFIGKERLIDIVFVLIAIGVAIYAREGFISYSGAFQQFFFQGERLLTTNDAYHFATATKDLIEGHIDNGFYKIASLELTSLLSAFLYYLLPFSLNTLMFYMPVVLASFLAMPVFMFMRRITNAYFAVFAAILAPLCIAYSSRTFGGYYDTDMLIITLPLIAVFFLYRILQNQRLGDIIACIVFSILSLYWHKVSATYIIIPSLFIALLYTMIKYKKNSNIYAILGVLFVATSYINIAIVLSIIALLLHFSIQKPLLLTDLTTKINQKIKYKNAIILTIGILFFIFANFELISSRFNTYVTSNFQTSNIIAIHNTSGTIIELVPLNFDEFAKQVSGGVVTFTISIIGILLMFIKNPRTLVLLPFLLISIGSMKLGSRFAMFGAPVFSIGFFYFLFILTQFINMFFKDKILMQGSRYAILLIGAFFIISPQYYKTKNYFTMPVLPGSELNALEAIKQDSKNRNDITISWWDYGFMIPYYANTRPVISGVDLDGVNQFIASFILSSTNQTSSYNMANLASFAINTNEFIEDNNLQKILKKYNVEHENIDVFINSLSNTTFKREPVSGNIYLFLPFSILSIQTAIDNFSNIDYKSGAIKTQEKDKTLAQYTSINEQDSKYILDGTLEFNPQNGELIEIKTNKKIQTQQFHIIERQKDNTLSTHTKIYNDDKSKLHIIYSKDLNMFFAIDERSNASLSVQLFIYENYNKELFELIFSDKQSKAYKLKKL